MKKICFKMPAFSLAEALITLLIVCLITLASVPVLTKKKRLTSNGTHGRWMCTLNSRGDYVSWSSSDPKGDTSNPDTWNMGCKFIPPINVSTYNITAIGAGGNGADGKSKLEKVADSQTTGGFRPEADGLYRILVVGGGGGGGGGRWRSDEPYCNGRRCGTGGAGGSGAYIIADVKLKSSYNYILSAGAGGAMVGGDFHGCSRRGANGQQGGTSSFYSEGSNYLKIEAEGGKGGSRTALSGRGTCKDRCSGGRGAAALGADSVTFTIDGVDKKATNVALGYGYGGQNGGCGVAMPNGTRGGSGFNASPFGITDGDLVNIGAGGNGGHEYPITSGKFNREATNGAPGRVVVYKIVRMQGGGGKASEPKDKVFMFSKGVFNISLGKNYLKDNVDVLNEDGTFNEDKYRTLRTTRVDLEHNGKITKSVISYPGDDGKQFEGTKPTKGENSYWTEDGGGSAAPAECVVDGRIPVKEGESDAPVVQICKKVKCTFDAGEEGNTIPSGYCVDGVSGCQSPQKMVSDMVDVFKYNGMTRTSMETYLKKLKNDFFKDFYVDPATGLVTYESIWIGRSSYFSAKDEDLQGFYNYETAVDGYGPLKNDNERCFRDETNKMSYVKTCDEEADKKLTAPNAKIIGYKTNYKCTNGGDAESKAYGAGGGGGYAFEQPDFASKGGKGAPGSVIIEW